jgi:glycosyltransferase involved in cell wall biosynthesis
MLGALACAFNPSPACIVTKRVAFPIRRGPLGIAKLKYFWRIDLYVAVCKAIKELLVAAGIDASKIHVVHSGVMPPDAENGQAVREELGLGADDKLVGTIGALVEAKGQRHLIEAAPLILDEAPETRFLIVGGGKLENELRKLAAQLRVADAVYFTGFQKEVGKFLAALDVFVLPSHMEGLNNSVIEAMMVGKPVIGTNVGGIPEIIEHGKTGVLIPPGNHSALAEAVAGMVKNPERAAALASAGRETARSRFTVDRMINGTTRVYETLLRDKCRT